MFTNHELFTLLVGLEALVHSHEQTARGDIAPPVMATAILLISRLRTFLEKNDPNY